MNKKLDSLIGQKAAEKVGKGWALTTFLREAWDSTKEEMKTPTPPARPMKIPVNSSIL
jgi:hypothetical protein